MSEQITWVKTPTAVERTGRSRSQLMRLVKAGFLTCGTHWLKGPSPGSPYTWNTDAIEQTLASQAPMPAPQSKALSLTEAHDHV